MSLLPDYTTQFNDMLANELAVFLENAKEAVIDFLTARVPADPAVVVSLIIFLTLALIGIVWAIRKAKRSLSDWKMRRDEKDYSRVIQKRKESKVQARELDVLRRELIMKKQRNALEFYESGVPRPVVVKKIRNEGNSPLALGRTSRRDLRGTHRRRSGRYQ